MGIERSIEKRVSTFHTYSLTLTLEESCIEMPVVISATDR